MPAPGGRHGNAKHIVAITFAAKRINECRAELNADAIDKKNQPDRGNNRWKCDVWSQRPRGQAREQDPCYAQPETENSHLAEQLADADHAEKRDNREVRQFINPRHFVAMMFDSNPAAGFNL